MVNVAGNTDFYVNYAADVLGAGASQDLIIDRVGKDAANRAHLDIDTFGKDTITSIDLNVSGSNFLYFSGDAERR